jgi:hypothetical protein
MTVEAWFRYAGTATDSYTAIIGSYDGGGTTEFFIGKNAGNTDFGIQDGTYNAGMATASNAWDGSWHHFAYTYQEGGTSGTGTGSLYLDGTLKSTNTFALNNASDIIYIGTELEGSGYYFPGDIDEVRFWNTVRTASQISTYKDVELNGNETGLVAYYKMSNGSGTTLADNASGSYSGTLVGGVTWTTGAVIMERTYSYTGAVQSLTIPAGVSKVTIEAWGAQGGNCGVSSGGYGTDMKGDFSVLSGDVLTIYTGGQGNSNTWGPGGGGGSGVIKGGLPIIVAGGGGGASYNGNSGKNASTGTSGVNSSGAGGIGGYGGNRGTYDPDPSDCGYGSGGGGYLGNGSVSTSGGGYSPANGGTGGTGGGCISSNFGGWGFGGGGSGAYAGGGGGGYSGGGGGQYRNTSESGLRQGGGGGSYNTGINTTNTVGARSGNGLVTITYISGSNPIINATATLSAFTTCSGTASAAQNFTASGTGLTADINVTAPTGYEVSTTSGTTDFAASVTLTQTGGTVSSTTIYARLTGAASGTPSGNISLASTGAAEQTVAASGTVTAASVGGTAKW